MYEDRVFETLEDYMAFAQDLLPDDWRGVDVFLVIDREAGALMASKMDAFPLEFKDGAWQEMSSRFSRDEVIRRSNEVVRDLLKMGETQLAARDNSYIPEIGLVKP